MVITMPEPGNLLVDAEGAYYRFVKIEENLIHLTAGLEFDAPERIWDMTGVTLFMVPDEATMLEINALRETMRQASSDLALKLNSLQKL